ncbi:hypothetical protein [Mycobacterium intracellulare]|uniref:hypothetical protein n=1 Tax=Mycobacterium intracellulare TaxID=1767 RepID=UPI002597CA53|nr:hypothetical protein [Mycobacterium intracellulare]MDM3894760.1 hypothetical protein [Mycobacterium intracellulare]
MPWKPSEPGEVPTLGYYVIDWITEYLAAPGREEYEPFIPYLEQEDFILRWYEIDPLTGRFKHHRGLLGRPRGWGKSPLLGALALVEGLGEVVPDGWDADGQPVGKPWSRLKTPLIHIAAVSEEQTANTWQPLLEMARNGPVLDEYSGFDPLDTVVMLPRGEIKQITTSARTTKGAPIVFATLDQTEEWVPSNNGPKLAQAIRTNAAKNGGRTLESPNAFIPGQNSVAEQSASYAADIREGRARNPGLLYDHREAPADTDMSDIESLTWGLRVAYGDSSGHPDGCVIHDPPCPPGHSELDPLIDQVFDPASDVQVLRADLLNQITHASDSWVSAPEWGACFDGEAIVRDRDVIVLGFDGSRGRVKGKADATALIGCRVSDGFLFEVGERSVWEPPRRELSKRERQKTGDYSQWTVPVAEVDAAIRMAFKRYTVVGFYADPSGWSEQVAKWEAAFGDKLHPKVKASGSSHIAAWPRGKNTDAVEAVRRLHSAITNGVAKHDGSSSLTRHMLNARRRDVRAGYLLYKSYPDSPDKIDAAYAAVMAWKARLDAVAAGAGRRKRRVVQRIR